jgi:hypothetical protein
MILIDLYSLRYRAMSPAATRLEVILFNINNVDAIPNKDIYKSLCCIYPDLFLKPDKGNYI